MAAFTELISRHAEEKGNVICLGMDPVVERIPIDEKSNEKKIVKFYSDILSAAFSENMVPAAVKPNYAFFAQYGFPGLRALKKIIRLCRQKRLLVILDAKRGDIGKTNEAYARECFDFWKADAVTVSPFLGFDCLEPFYLYLKKGKGIYILTRTSNKGASDFQEQEIDGKKVYMRIAELILSNYSDGMCAVVGATDVQELKQINSFFSASGKKVPLLIPGVGSQGGSALDVSTALKSVGSTKIHRVNSSSAINYAYEKFNTKDYADAAVKALKELKTGGLNAD